MPFTLRSTPGGDVLVVDGEVVENPSGARVTLYAEDGTDVLGSFDVAGDNALRVVDWAPSNSTYDTLITGDGDDVIVWDAVTAFRFDFENLDRARLPDDPARAVEIFDLGAGSDILNLTHLDTSGSPNAYRYDTTAYGGAGDDRLAFGAGSDVGHGDDGSDLLWGGAGDDTLQGGTGVDSLFGGSGADILLAQVDEVAVDGDEILGWDGNGDLSIPRVVALAEGDQIARGYFDGGITGVGFLDATPDTLVMDMPEGGPGSRNVLNLSAPGSPLSLIFGIEVIVASAAADIVNLTGYDGATGFAYESDVTVLAGDGNDIVFAGLGSDLIVGDALGGTTGFSDTLFGGAGSDTIFGDSDGDGPGAADTIYGGFSPDTVFGGAGDDAIFDLDGGSFSGGLGADLLVLHFADTGPGRADGGPDDTTAGVDGDDRVFISGVYDTVESELGQGNDIYIALANETGEGGSGRRVDIVYGGEGIDAVSSWYGNDTIFGGPGDDVIWTGEGDDYVSGGDGADILYIEGGNDQAYGGAGYDYYYVMMGGGVGFADIYDEAREGLAPESDNVLILAGAFDVNETGPEADAMQDGSGIYDLNHDLELLVLDEGGSPIDVVQLTYLEETTWQIENLNTGYIVQFDQRDFDVIMLADHEAPPGTAAVQYYVWSDDAQTYLYYPV